jgi:protein TonB
MAPVILAFFLGLQMPSVPTGFAPNCAAPPDAAISSLCAGEELMRRAIAPDADDEQRDSSWEHASEAFRRAADLSHDPAAKRFALERLETVYDEKHLDRARDAEPVLRELIVLSPADLAPLFRLARVQERQEQFEGAESTLLAAHQMKPDEIEPYRELAQFFARRAAALSAERERQDRADHPRDSNQPGRDGIYRLGEGVPAPEKISPDLPVSLPADVVASGVKGSVALEIVVGVDGRVTDARVLRSVPMLDATALATVRQWRFRPVVLDGRPIPVRMTVVLNF